MNRHEFQKNFEFPPTESAHPSGFLVEGGDLSARRLIEAYRKGIFPYFENSSGILWWTPHPRAIIYTDKFRISKSLRRTLLRQDYRITIDRRFDEVIRSCADRGEENTWIGNDMIEAYQRLHEAGYAHSVEVMKDDILVGGLYGTSIWRVFFGESMFHRSRDCSKIAMSHLIAVMRHLNFSFLDCQFITPHLLTLGACEVSRAYFQKLLRQAEAPDTRGNWSSYEQIDFLSYLF